MFRSLTLENLFLCQAMPGPIAVQLPSWPGKPNIVYYSQYPGSHALYNAMKGGPSGRSGASAQGDGEPPAKRRRGRGPSVADRRLMELREFKEKHGHTWVMRKKNSRFHVKGLGNWCEKMREKKKKGLLGAEIERALVDIGFVWEWKDVPFKCTKKRTHSTESEDANKMLLRIKKLEEDNRRLKERNAMLKKAGLVGKVAKKTKKSANARTPDRPGMRQSPSKAQDAPAAAGGEGPAQPPPPPPLSGAGTGGVGASGEGEQSGAVEFRKELEKPLAG